LGQANEDDEDDDEEQKPPPAVDLLVSMGLELKLMRTEHDEYFAAIPLSGQVEAVELSDRRFANHLLRQYRNRYQTVAPPHALSNSVRMLEALCEAEPITNLHSRVLRVDKTIHVNLGEGKQAILTPQGWRVVNDGDTDVLFRKPAGQGPLPVPVTGGSLNDLRPFINHAGDEQFVLIAGFIVATFGGGPYLFLVLNGEQGSAKSTATRLVVALTDPCGGDNMQLPNDIRNLFVTVREHHVLPCENVSHISREISNAACSISTGTTFYHRGMGKDKERTVFRGYGALVMNGIEDFAKAPDLRSRCIILNLPRITQRKDEKTLRAEFEQARPRILGAIFDAVCAGLANEDNVTLTTEPRMMDAVKFITAAEHGAPWPVGTFEKAYQTNQSDSQGAALAGSHVAVAIMELMEKEGGEWRGTWPDLKKKLERLPHYLSGSVPPRRWPNDGKELSDEVTRYQPTLRAQGIDVERGIRIGKQGSRGAIIRRIHGGGADKADTPAAPLSAVLPPSGAIADMTDRADTHTLKKGRVKPSPLMSEPPSGDEVPETASATSAVSALKWPEKEEVLQEFLDKGTGVHNLIEVCERHNWVKPCGDCRDEAARSAQAQPAPLSERPKKGRVVRVTNAVEADTADMEDTDEAAIYCEHCDFEGEPNEDGLHEDGTACARLDGEL